MSRKCHRDEGANGRQALHARRRPDHCSLRPVAVQRAILPQKAAQDAREGVRQRTRKWMRPGKASCEMLVEAHKES